MRKLLLIIPLFLFVSCSPEEPLQIESLVPEICTNHSDCPSNVCDHFKADQGNCAPKNCTAGEKADNNIFYCDESGNWQSSRLIGDNCDYDYECYSPTCFMNPMCELSDFSNTGVYCNKTCVQEITQNECEKMGLKKVLRKDQYSHDVELGCMESMAQMVLPTVCIDCGNGVCEEENESECNCPEDCREPLLNEPVFAI